MTSTDRPVLASLIPDCLQANSHSTLQPDDVKPNFLNRCATWRSNVLQPQDAYPSPHSHETMLQEPSNMDIFCLPPFWETTRDSDLTIRLISAQRSERRAETRLIRRRLKRIMIEHELYHHMDQNTARRLHKADIGVGVSRVTFQVYSMIQMQNHPHETCCLSSYYEFLFH
ncbi:hypothetical protein P692DRAFT_20822276 [Suillus brevipes Sb2]|nr:hypothetical protein P692DRAFT_20822276 [Suillus brevipes Sb2]